MERCCQEEKLVSCCGERERRILKFRMSGGRETHTLPHKRSETAVNHPLPHWLCIVLEQAFKRIASADTRRLDSQMKESI